MEDATSQQVRGSVELLDTVERQDLHYEEVAGQQIIGALLQELGVRFAKGYLYQVLQGVANEARRRGLLINPNHYERTTYSTAVGNTSRMLPSAVGWEQTKGIFTRHLCDARRYLMGILRERGTQHCPV